MAVKFQDYYETLGVPRTASAEEIKQAFRKLARLHHPDVAKNKAAGEAKFKEINEAYEVLGDPEKRRRYDELGANWQDSGGGTPGPARAPQGEPAFEFDGTGFSDFFESFFGGGRGGFGRFRQPAGREEDEEESFAYQGQDVEADLLVTLEEALRGARRKVTLRRPAMDGEAERTNTYQVRIPPGVREGQRIRLAGQGGTGMGGGAAGDLYLRVRLARHPDFSVQGADLYCDLDLAPWEAVLGVKAKISTLDGPTSLRVPPGTAAGSQLRLRGLGLPRVDHTRGDLYATVRVRVPSSVSAEERALWEKLARTSTFKPRSKS
ncbi:MAG TPA: DnaJ C-terminal domain-containing protein [Opitutaceae bacterium]|nr:DnaJ C-terminal domain-containing protein [Opitutaceae bacterium]